MGEFQYILIITLGQGLVLAFFLIVSRFYRTPANQWLAISLILLSTLSIIDLLGSQYAHSSIFLEFLLHDMQLDFLVYIPLFYFFNISISSPKKKPRFNFYLILPFIIDTLVNIAIVTYYPIEAINANSGIQIFYEVETILSIIFNSFLCYQSYILIKTYDNNSNRKDWIYNIWQSTVIILIIWLFIILGGYLMNSALSMLIDALYTLVSIWMFWMIYNGIVNLKLIDDRKDISLKLGNKATLIKKTESNQITSSPNPDLFDKHFNKIHRLMVSETLYRNEDLSIDDVAHLVGMSAGYISKIIKKATNKNFPIWVNEFRIGEVQSMFKDQDFNNYTTLSIGLEAGFKSKSAFYAVFKKMTGETPAKFRNKKS